MAGKKVRRTSRFGWEKWVGPHHTHRSGGTTSLWRRHPAVWLSWFARQRREWFGSWEERCRAARASRRAAPFSRSRGVARSEIYAPGWRFQGGYNLFGGQIFLPGSPVAGVAAFAGTKNAAGSAPVRRAAQSSVHHMEGKGGSGDGENGSPGPDHQPHHQGSHPDDYPTEFTVFIAKPGPVPHTPPCNVGYEPFCGPRVQERRGQEREMRTV